MEYCKNIYYPKMSFKREELNSLRISLHNSLKCLLHVFQILKVKMNKFTFELNAPFFSEMNLLLMLLLSFPTSLVIIGCFVAFYRSCSVAKIENYFSSPLNSGTLYSILCINTIFWYIRNFGLIFQSNSFYILN